MKIRSHNIKYFLIFYVLLDLVANASLLKNTLVVLTSYIFGVIMMVCSNAYVYYKRDETRKSVSLFLDSFTSRIFIALGTFSIMKVSFIAPIALGEGTESILLDLLGKGTSILYSLPTIVSLISLIIYTIIIVTYGYNTLAFIPRKTNAIFMNEITFTGKLLFYSFYSVLMLSLVLLLFLLILPIL